MIWKGSDGAGEEVSEAIEAACEGFGLKMFQDGVEEGKSKSANEENERKDGNESGSEVGSR